VLKPAKSLLICGTPRSGTSLLCGYLANTSLAGHPREYYWKENELDGYKNWGVKTYAEYLKMTKELGTTPNGVFSAKVMWGYFSDFLTKLRNLPGKEGLNDKELLDSAFSNLRFIFIQREDVVAQAVSWAIAVQTEIWFSGDTRKPKRVPDYNFGLINQFVNEIKEHNKCWNEWFKKFSVVPCVVKYEELALRPKKVVSGILNILDISHPKDLTIVPGIKKQGGEINKEWVERYSKASPRRV
jgi:LPS sulfotransferase NodH